MNLQKYSNIAEVSHIDFNEASEPCWMVPCLQEICYCNDPGEQWRRRFSDIAACRRVQKFREWIRAAYG